MGEALPVDAPNTAEQPQRPPRHTRAAMPLRRAPRFDETGGAGFSIDAALTTTRAMAARIAAGAPDLSITVHDPRESLRAWFKRRSDPGAFGSAGALGGGLSPQYAASPTGADSLHPAQELVFALHAVSAEPAGAGEPALPPSRVAADWANDHELGHLADRATTDRAAWFERYDRRIKHVREITADGFAHVLAILRHGAAGEREANARSDWRAHNLIAYGDEAHFTSYARAPFVRLGRALRAAGETPDGIDPLALARRCRELAMRLALQDSEIEAVRRGAPAPPADGLRAATAKGFARHRLAARRRSVDAGVWYRAMTRANPADAALLCTAEALARLDRAANGLDTMLSGPARDAPPREDRQPVVTLLRSIREVIDRPLAGGALERVAGLHARTVELERELLGAGNELPATRTLATLVGLQQALALAWEGVEQGLLPGYLDRVIREQTMALLTLARALPVHP
jgi:hypothetical protein